MKKIFLVKNNLILISFELINYQIINFINLLTLLFNHNFIATYHSSIHFLILLILILLNIHLSCQILIYLLLNFLFIHLIDFFCIQNTFKVKLSMQIKILTVKN
jgi:hypothetical protein